MDIQKKGIVPTEKSMLFSRAKRNIALYVFLLPALTYVIIFEYIPLYGIQIAFKDFNPYVGIWRSPFIGLKHFERFITGIQFWNLLKNSLVINIYQLIAGFPVPIILALLLNYCPNQRYKRFIQTVTYAPHFISTVVMVGIILIFLSPRNGMVNILLGFLGVKPIHFMAKPELFKSIYVFSGIWQGAGWGAIIYIATLASVNLELHEAAIVDGATKLKRIWYIDIPCILPTAIILLILNMGNMLGVGFQKIYLMQNDINLPTSEVISTYVYKVGLLSAQFSYSTAIGLFNNVINFVILVVVNKISRKYTEISLW